MNRTWVTIGLSVASIHSTSVHAHDSLAAHTHAAEGLLVPLAVLLLLLAPALYSWVKEK